MSSELDLSGIDLIDSKEGILNLVIKNKLDCPYDGCNASFSKQNKLTYHIRRHNGERPYLCTAFGCGKSYTNSTHLLRHCRDVHNPNKPKETFPCSHEGCTKQFANKYSLKVHIRRFHEYREYPFKCEICDQAFFKDIQLQNHSFIHSGVLPFKCEICGRRFATNKKCKQHKSYHSIYSCDCGETLYLWPDLVAHRKICILTMKEFICDICKKTFSSQTNLNSHQATHKEMAERKIYACEYEGCERIYFYKNNLNHHVTTFHEKKKKKIPCPVEGCNAQLSKMQSLNYHLMLHKTGRKVKTGNGNKKYLNIESTVNESLVDQDLDYSNESIINSESNKSRETDGIKDNQTNMATHEKFNNILQCRIKQEIDSEPEEYFKHSEFIYEEKEQVEHDVLQTNRTFEFCTVKQEVDDYAEQIVDGTGDYYDCNEILNIKQEVADSYLDVHIKKEIETDYGISGNKQVNASNEYGELLNLKKEVTDEFDLQIKKEIHANYEICKEYNE